MCECNSREKYELTLKWAGLDSSQIPVNGFPLDRALHSSFPWWLNSRASRYQVLRSSGGGVK